ncbi:hypothetical protein FHG87_017589 [Trinorchestia longiramus]|nr:hypothetical protein FHG87_017589 [Trinorchestia longiramus]
MNMTKHDLRLLMLHEFKLRHNASEASANINRAWGEESTRDRTVRRCFGKSRSGDESLKDEEGRGRLGSLENEQLHVVVEQNPRQSVREMFQTLDVSIATVSHHLKIIGKVKKLDKWVPHELNENQKLRRFEVCSMLSLRNTNDPFLDRIVTCDENWSTFITPYSSCGNNRGFWYQPTSSCQFSGHSSTSHCIFRVDLTELDCFSSSYSIKNPYNMLADIGSFLGGSNFPPSYGRAPCPRWNLRSGNNAVCCRSNTAERTALLPDDVSALVRRSAINESAAETPGA